MKFALRFLARSSPWRAARWTLFLVLIAAGPGPAMSSGNDVTLLAVGDVMLGRYIAKVMTSRGADYPFQEVTPALKHGDIVFGNLEAVICDDGPAPLFPDKPYNFHASPAAAGALRKAGFHVLSLANNHAMDYGPEALAKTRRLLEENGIIEFGAGEDLAAAHAPRILTVKGVRFGFLGYSVAHSNRVYARQGSPGIAPVQLDMIRKDIGAVRGKVDVLVISLHWGKEYDTIPSQKQREQAHQLVDWGADLILGHHPHVTQGIELYKGKVIAYSLGNFVFDQKKDGTDWSVMLACTFRGKELHSVEAIPLGRFRSYFPTVADGELKKQLLEKLKTRSMPLNAAPEALSRVGWN